MKKELKFKFNVSDVVKVVNVGESYPCYPDWFGENAAMFLKRYQTPAYPTEYKIVARGKHHESEDVVYAIEDLETKQVCLIHEMGLEVVKRKESKPQYDIPLSDFFRERLKMHSTIFYNSLQPKSPYGDYTNVFKDKINLVIVNHKKKQVIIRWNDGTKTKATCDEKDDFDIKVGFAIAFTRKFFKNDKKLHSFIASKRPKNNLGRFFVKGERGEE